MGVCLLAWASMILLAGGRGTPGTSRWMLRAERDSRQQVESHQENGFRTQTGQNINVAANGIAKLLRMMIEEDD